MSPEQIVLDIDGAGDDILAVLFAAGCPGIALQAVTTVTGAAGSVEQVTRVAFEALRIAGRDDVPVARGAHRPIVGNSAEDMEAPVHFEKRLRDRFGDRLATFNPPAPEPRRAPDPRPAAQLIAEIVRASPGEISLVATGPQTNVALALRLAPDLAHLAKRIVVLGGCFRTPGNITPVSEYNVWADPEAARVVLRCGAPVTLVPLDVCEDDRVAPSMLTRDDLADLRAAHPEGAAVRHVAETFPIYIDIWREFFGLRGFPLDDAIAAATVLAPEWFSMSPPTFVDVALHERLVRGQTVARRGRQILPMDGPETTRVCEDLDGAAFMAAFKDALGRLP